MKYLSIFISLVISILSLEIFVRYSFDNGMNYEIEMMKYANKLKIISKDKNVGIEHRKNIKSFLMGAEIILNSDGFRNNKNVIPEKKKILMLGDSMTLGWGAKKPFSNILDDKINNFQIINAGIGNTNTLMQIANFEKNFKNKYNYDIIVLNFFINDFEKVEIIKPNFLEKYSYFYTFILNKINIILIKFNLKKSWETFYSDSYKNKEIHQKTLNKILQLNYYCKENSIKFIIHNIPELRDLKNYKFKNETKIISEFSVKNDITFLNSHSILKNYNPQDLWVTELDPHANDKAHDIIADFLLDKIAIYVN